MRSHVALAVVALAAAGCAHGPLGAASTRCVDPASVATANGPIPPAPICSIDEPRVVAFDGSDPDQLADEAEIARDIALAEAGSKSRPVAEPQPEPAAVPEAVAVAPVRGGLDLSLPSNDSMRAVAERVAEHPQVLAAREREKASADEIRKARAAFFPTINLEGSRGIHDAVQGRSRDDPSLSPYTYGVKAELTVFDGMQRRNRLMRARDESDAAAAGTRDTVQQTLVDAVTLLAQSTRDGAVLGHRRAYLGQLEKVLRETRARKREGDASDTDVQQVVTRIEAAQSSIRLAEASLADTDAQLRSYLDDLKMSGLQLRELGGRLPDSEGAARDMALANNPLLERAGKQADAAERERWVAQGAFLPRVALVGEVQSADDQYQGDRHGTDVQVGLQVSVPVFAGGARMADLSQKRHEETAARYEVDTARRQVLAGVDGAWSRMVENDRAVTHSEARINAARRALKGVVASRELDESTTLDVLNAHQEVMAAEIESEELKYARIVSRHLLMAQVGRLDEAYGLKVTDTRPRRARPTLF